MQRFTTMGDLRALQLSVILLAMGAHTSIAAENPKVLMLVPDDFMWPEYGVPRRLYEEAGFQVTTAGRFAGEVRPDRRNAKDYPDSHPVRVDLTFEEVDPTKFDAVTCVAGNGAWHDFFPSETVHKIVKGALDQGKIVGLLCASTGLLGLIGNADGEGRPVAEGKSVVGYFRVGGILKKLGKVRLIEGGAKEPGIAVDGNLVTGRNPESSDLFGAKVVELLKGGK